MFTCAGVYIKYHNLGARGSAAECYECNYIRRQGRPPIGAHIPASRARNSWRAYRQVERHHGFLVAMASRTCSIWRGCIHVYIYTHMWIHVCIWERIYICYKFMYIRIYIMIQMWIYVYVYAYSHVYTWCVDVYMRTGSRSRGQMARASLSAWKRIHL